MDAGQTTREFRLCAPRAWLGVLEIASPWGLHRLRALRCIEMRGDAVVKHGERCSAAVVEHLTEVGGRVCDSSPPKTAFSK